LLPRPASLIAVDIKGSWVRRGVVTPSRTQTYDALDVSNEAGVDFNINWDIRHGPEGGNGTYVGASGLSVQVIEWNATTQQHELHTQTGSFSPNCTAITWDATPWDARSTTAGLWCKAWTVGCSPEPPPPYGDTLAFLQTLGDNMVLQRAPAKAAVYGVYGPEGAPKDAKITVTVVPKGGGAPYTVNAEVNTVHQAQGGWPAQTPDFDRRHGSLAVSDTLAGCSPGGVSGSRALSALALPWLCARRQAAPPLRSRLNNALLPLLTQLLPATLPSQS
jgi:hypothetical protein